MIWPRSQINYNYEYIWFSKRDNPTVIRYWYYKWNDERWCSVVIDGRGVSARVRECAQARAARRRWLSQSLRVVCSRCTRVAESVDHARSRPTHSTKQNRYKYNQMSNKVNNSKRSREQWIVCVLEYCVEYLHIQLYKLIQRNKLYTTDNIKTAVMN